MNSEESVLGYDVGVLSIGVVSAMAGGKGGESSYLGGFVLIGVGEGVSVVIYDDDNDGSGTNMSQFG